MGTSLLPWVQDTFSRGLFALDARIFGLTSEGNSLAWKGYAAVAAAKGLVTSDELTLLKNLSDWLEIDRSRLRAMVEKILPVEMHESQDAEMILGVTTEMDKEEARHQLNREYAKWSSRVISSDPSIRRQADQMLQLLAEARTEYVGVRASQ